VSSRDSAVRVVVLFSCIFSFPAFREFFSRVTDLASKPSGAAGPSLQVSAETLIEHNPALTPDAFEVFRQPPHLGVPPSVPPLCIPVHDDQPSSIIAYTLASLEHLLTVGRIRPTEVKMIQAVQSWMAYEEEQTVHTLESSKRSTFEMESAEDHPRSQSSAEATSPADHTTADASRTSSPPAISQRISVPFAAPILHMTSPSPESDEPQANGTNSHPQSHSNDDLTSSYPLRFATPPVPTTGAPLPSSSTLHHSYSDHHVSFLYPNSLHTALPHRAPPQLPYHLTCPSLLGFDPIRDRLDQVESNMTNFVTGEFATQSSSSSSGPASSASTDHAAQTFKYQFEDTGMNELLHHDAASGHASADGPHADVERTTFRCTVYFPKQFHALRLMTCGGDYEFIQSLCHCNRWGITGGKSGSTFLKTSDERFILKFITRTELKMFLEHATKYFAYMAKNLFHSLPSFLVKILGVYQLSWKKHNYQAPKKSTQGGTSGASGSGETGHASSLSSQYVLVMPNLFYSHSASITKVFDLKGSARNRYIKRKNREENRVLLDENLMECQWRHTRTHNSTRQR
jgi:hypothetical protein